MHVMLLSSCLACSACAEYFKHMLSMCLKYSTKSLLSSQNIKSQKSSTPTGFNCVKTQRRISHAWAPLKFAWAVSYVCVQQWMGLIMVAPTFLCSPINAYHWYHLFQEPKVGKEENWGVNSENGIWDCPNARESETGLLPEPFLIHQRALLPSQCLDITSSKLS